MTFKPAVWYPIAIGLSVINLVGVGFAAASTESWHAAVHATLALAFGLWAQRLRRRPGGGELPGPGGSEFQDRLEALEGEVSKVRQELSDTQERLDFAERMLAQGRETRRMGPQP
jgi:hypothetical protein